MLDKAKWRAYSRCQVSLTVEAAMELENKGAMTVHGASPAVLLAAAAWLAVYVAARLALRYLRPESFEAVAMAIAPLFAFFAFVWVVQRAVRRADELHRLIQLT